MYEDEDVHSDREEDVEGSENSLEDDKENTSGALVQQQLDHGLVPDN